MASCKPEEKKKQFDGSSQLIDANLKKGWYKQAFLMSYIGPLTEPLVKNQNPSKYVKLINPGPRSAWSSHAAVINRLTIPRHIINLFDGRPIDYSQLVPHIEISKVYIKDSKYADEVPFPFTTFSNFAGDWTPQNLLKGPFRGRDAGIQSIHTEMSGKSSLFEGLTAIRVTVKYVFNDIATLFKTWKTFSGRTVQYSDLIRHTGQVGTVVKGQGFPFDQNYGTKIVLGWNVNPDNPLFKESMWGGGYGTDFVKAIEYGRISFIGTIKTHEMDFKEDGSVVLTAHYEGAFENATRKPAADILKGYSFDDSGTVRQVKAELDKLDVMVPSKVDSKGQKSSGKQIKKIAERLDAAAETINGLLKAAKGNNTYVDVQPELSKDYEAYKETSTKSVGDTFQQKALENAASGLPSESNSQNNAKPPTSKINWENVVEQLAKSKSMLSNALLALEGNMRAKNIFSYILQLMADDKMAWISTEGAAFQSWVKYREEINNKETIEAANKRAKAEAAAADKAASESADADAGITTPPIGELSEAEKELIKAFPNHYKAAASKAGLSSPKDDAAAGIKGALSDGKKSNQPFSNKMLVKTFKKLGATPQLFVSGKYTPGDKMLFFTLGDLVSTILDVGGIGQGIEKQLPDFRIIFGNINYNAIGSNNLTTTSLYNLPISLEVFIQFISKKIIGEGKSTYPLNTFIKDLIGFVTNAVIASVAETSLGGALVRPAGGDVGNFNIEMVSIDMPKDFLVSNMTGEPALHENYLLDFSLSNQGKYTVARKSLPFMKSSNALLLIAGRANDNWRSRMNARKPHVSAELDREEGIPHFMVGGPNRGLLKSIKFSDINWPGYKEMLLEQAGQHGTIDPRGFIFPQQLGCELVLVGNPYMWIGQIIYVNAKLISRGHGTTSFLQYGGYYDIVKVENYIKEGTWETRVHAQINTSDQTGEVLKKPEVVTPLSADEKYEKMLAEGLSPQAASDALMKEMKGQSKEPSN